MSMTAIPQGGRLRWVEFVSWKPQSSPCLWKRCLTVAFMSNEQLKELRNSRIISTTDTHSLSAPSDTLLLQAKKKDP
jgi:hypothetical protein